MGLSRDVFGPGREMTPVGGRLPVPGLHCLTGQQVVERRGELVQLGEVSRGQGRHEPVTLLGEVYAHYARVLAVLLATDDAGGLRTVDKPYGAVALQLQVLGKLADGWRLGSGMALDRYQQLMLGMCQPGRGRLVLAPAQETTQRRAKPEKVLEILMRRLNGTALLRAKPKAS